MVVIQDEIIPHNSGRSFIVKKGQRIRVIGETTCDFVVFNYDNLWERFDQARTKANQVQVYLTTGDVLYSKINNIRYESISKLCRTLILSNKMNS